jgi:phosphoglycolate phosphatase
LAITSDLGCKADALAMANRRRQGARMTKPILVFDLDGTFAHTAPDLLDSLNHCLTLVDLPPADPASLMRYVGHGGKVMIERAMQARGRTVSPPDLDRLMKAFIDHYEATMPGKTKPFEGALAVLDRFDDAGWIHAICTNKYEGMSKRLLAGMGQSDRFKAICGQDTFAFKKPDPRHLTETIRLAGGDPDQAIMVGDSVTDIDTAKAAGIPVVAVSFGYSDRPVRELDASVVIDGFHELTLDLGQRLLRAAKGR